jgi:phosphatidylserine decarboxylase
MKVKDLKAYPNLSAFFYRELEEGARPIADAPLVRSDRVGTTL